MKNPKPVCECGHHELKHKDYADSRCSQVLEYKKIANAEMVRECDCPKYIPTKKRSHK